MVYLLNRPADQATHVLINLIGVCLSVGSSLWYICFFAVYIVMKPRVPSPCTPRAGPVRRSFTPPRAPRILPLPQLLRAIEINSASELRKALERDVSIAQEPFWDHGIEPPICAAVRCGCDPQIFEILLAHGADVDATTMEGKTAIQLQTDSTRFHFTHRSEPKRVARIIALLREFGASCGDSGPNTSESQLDLGSVFLWPPRTQPYVRMRRI